MDVLSTFELSDKYSIGLSRRNKPVHFGSSLDFLYCTLTFLTMFVKKLILLKILQTPYEMSGLKSLRFRTVLKLAVFFVQIFDRRKICNNSRNLWNDCSNSKVANC